MYISQLGHNHPVLSRGLKANMALYGMSIYHRNNVKLTGSGNRTMILAHGFGCDQNMWRPIIPAFESEYRIVLFDHVGAGKSDCSQYRRDKYGSLQAYAEDLLELIKATGAGPSIFVGHSVSAMIGVLAAAKEPRAFEHLILVGPSPCYINDGDYVGGFTRSDIESLLETLESNYLGWSSTMAPMIMGTPDRPELGAELTDSFCRTDPEIAKHFAQVTFLSDNRLDLCRVHTPSLILQCSEDIIAPECVGEFVHRHLRNSRLIQLRATGHCPHVSAPEETAAAIKKYLGRSDFEI